MAEFKTPAFLQNHSPEEVHALMKRVVPADIDMSAGSHAYNLTIATALAIAEVCEFVLPEVVKVIFPEYSYGEFLDGHARVNGMTRRSASAASGTITITGDPSTVIPAGSLFSTASVNDHPSVDYATLEDAEIPASGTVTVDVACTKAGIIGNTTENTIVLVSSRLTGVKAVTNEKPLTGGTEEESDEALIARIVEFNKSQGESYVGSASDYKRWALSVDGVGSATVIPAQDTSGLVTIIITDSNGYPATEQLCTSVYNYIMNPDNPEERLAPINANLLVTPPTAVAISIRATVELDDEATMEAVKTEYAAQLARYLPVALEEGVIKYSRVAAALAAVKGVSDYSDLKFGLKDGEITKYSTSNVAITSNKLPTIDEDDLILTSGTV